MVCQTAEVCWVFAELELALGDQTLYELRVVDHLYVPNRVWHGVRNLPVFVSHCVEAVRAGCYHFLDVVSLHRVDVLPCQYLEQVFIAHASRRVAGASLLCAQDCKVDIGFHQQRCHGTGYINAAINQCAGASDPEQHFGIGILSDGRHVFHALTPRLAC